MVWRDGSDFYYKCADAGMYDLSYQPAQKKKTSCEFEDVKAAFQKFVVAAYKRRGFVEEEAIAKASAEIAQEERMFKRKSQVKYKLFRKRWMKTHGGRWLHLKAVRWVHEQAVKKMPKR